MPPFSRVNLPALLDTIGAVPVALTFGALIDQLYFSDAQFDNNVCLGGGRLGRACARPEQFMLFEGRSTFPSALRRKERCP